MDINKLEDEEINRLVREHEALKKEYEAVRSALRGREKEERIAAVKGISMSLVGIILLSAFVAFVLWGCPKYKVYQLRLSGEAHLREAEWNRQILVQEAHAKKEAAKDYADAEVERAKGVAQANKIIGDSLEGNESYLRYLWIQGIHEGDNEVIYVPTEANLPILESVRKIQNAKPLPTVRK